MPHPLQPPAATLIRSVAGAALISALGACASDLGGAPVRQTVVAPSDFSDGSARTAAPATSAPQDDVQPVAEAPEPADAGDVVVLVGAPRAAPARAPSAPPARSAGTRFQVDQMVGQINGRPIYAADFFAPMDARLRREAQRLSPREFMQLVRKDIFTALRGRLQDELLLAEFESTITPEQQKGILAFINQVRDQIVSQNLGAEELAEQRLLEGEGVSLDQKVDDVTKLEFVREQLRREIGARVNVSYRDIRKFYERNKDLFNPPPKAIFRVIRIPKDDPVKVAIVASDMDAGTPIRDIVESIGTWKPEEGGIREIELGEDGLEGAELFGVPELNDPAIRLKPGQTTERIEYANSYWWIHLEAIFQPPSQSLYDVQLEIEQILLSERQSQEQQRYFQRLYERGSFSDIEEMIEKLWRFAADRYLLQPGATPASP